MELRYFIIRRVLLMIPTIFGLTILVFLLIRSLPDALLVQGYVNPRSAVPIPVQIERAKIALGLNFPAPVQYFFYLSNLLHGDWGYMSVNMFKGPVLKAIEIYFPNTFQIVIFSIILSIVIAIPLGTYIGARPNSAADQIGRVFSLSGYAMPAFWLALLLQVLFASYLPISHQFDATLFIPFPPNWAVDPQYGIIFSSPTHVLFIDALLHGDFALAWSVLEHLILPVLTLTYGILAGILRFLRAGMVDASNSEYVKTARSKGVPEKIVIRKHIRKNAMLPTITVLGLLFVALLGGVVLIEYVFAYPGIGLLGAEAAGAAGEGGAISLYGVMGVTLIFGLMLIVANLVVDIIYAFLDPRIRY